MSDQHTNSEEFQVNGEQLVARIKEILHQGNIRRLIIKDREGRTLIEVPLTIGVVGALLVPVWAAIGAIAALVVEATIVLKKWKSRKGLSFRKLPKMPAQPVQCLRQVSGHRWGSFRDSQRSRSRTRACPHPTSTPGSLSRRRSAARL